LAKAGGKASILWLIPVFCVVTLFAAFTKGSQEVIGRLTGAFPFFLLGYQLSQNGKDLMEAISFGGYLSLSAGLALFILPRCMKYHSISAL